LTAVSSLSLQNSVKGAICWSATRVAKAARRNRFPRLAVFLSYTAFITF